MATADLAMTHDDVLATLAAGGDRAAMEVLFERHAPMAVAFACTILGNRDDALDAAQIALMQLAREVISGWRGRPFKSCLYTCVHQAASHLQLQSSGRRRREKAAADDNTKKEAQMCPDPVDRDEELLALRQELVALPAETAALLALHHLDGLPVGEIAGQMALSVDACKQRLLRGREQLRERLERRGIVLSGASLVAALLDKGFAVGKALAGPGDAIELTRIARAAAASGSAAAPGGLGAEQSANHAQNLKPQVNSPARTDTSVRGKLLVRAAAVAAIVALCYTFLTTKNQGTPQPSPKALPSAPVQKPAADESASAPIAPVVKPPNLVEAKAAARWQQSRFIDKNFAPLSISARGNQVMLLAADESEKKGRLVLIESPDGGESWNTVASIDGYKNGAAELDGLGGCVVLGLVRWDAPRDKDGFPTARGFSCARIECRRWTRETGVSSPEIVWKSADPVVEDMNGAVKDAPLRMGFCEQWAPRLISVEGGMWAFALQQTQRGLQFDPTSVRCAVAFIRKDASPQTINFESSGRAENVPSAWARDAQSAGIVLASEDGQKLKHFVTSDGGNTWQTSEIPFTQTADSGGDPLQIVTAGLTRDREHLALLVNSAHWETNQPAGGGKRSTIKISRIPGGYSTNSDSIYGEDQHQVSILVDQTHLLSSPDLGKSWMIASPPSECESIKCEHGPAGVRIGAKGMIVCHDQYGRIIEEMKMEMTFRGTSPEVQEMLKNEIHPIPKHTTSAIAVRESNDGGQTWQDRRIFDELGDGVSHVVIGGDATSMHLAAVKQNGAHQKCLVIRSFSSGEWRPQEDTPVWLKKASGADPPRQEF